MSCTVKRVQKLGLHVSRLVDASVGFGGHVRRAACRVLDDRAYACSIAARRSPSILRNASWARVASRGDSVCINPAMVTSASFTPP